MIDENEPDGVAELIAATRAEIDENVVVSLGFLTQQGVRHASRETSYRNHVLSLRVGDAVGSCAVEPGTLDEDVVLDCVGAPVRDLLGHPALPVRIAALDAYLMWRHPHAEHAEPVVVPLGTSLEKSLVRAKHVVDLLNPVAGQRVLVIGVVNSLLHELRERGVRYVPCDLKGGRTEWGEPVVTDALAELAHCDAVLASGMTLGNGTFDPVRRRAWRAGTPLVVFAQTGSAVVPVFLGRGVTAVSAEPYPFFWLDGGPSVLHRCSTGFGEVVR